MTIEKAKAVFETEHPGLTVLKIFDWDDTRYVISAVEDPDRNDYVDPFFYVDKNDETIGSFAPGEDFERFADLMSD